MTEQRKRKRESPGARTEDLRSAKKERPTLKEVREQAGVVKETVHKALHRKGVGQQSSRAIASLLGEGLSETEVEALEEELRLIPQKNV
jgi:hypothetical protein